MVAVILGDLEDASVQPPLLSPLAQVGAAAFTSRSHARRAMNKRSRVATRSCRAAHRSRSVVALQDAAFLARYLLDNLAERLSGVVIQAGLCACA